MADSLAPFHLAIPVDDLSSSRKFYGEFLGCSEGRSAERWVDFNFFGHQMVCHVQEKVESGNDRIAGSNPVDGHAVPVPHFGVVLELESWKALVVKLRAAGIEFVIEPYIRFEGEPGEQATMFFLDPSGNALEFKAFRDIEAELFAT
ncbi:MAG: VOC family protein [Roseibacillus sp.]|nr:VOC family protein [Roseibacillus sp.]